MLDNDHCSAAADQRPEDAHECLHIQRVQADGGLVEDKHRVRLCLPHLTCQLQALRLAAGEAGRLFPERQVSQSQILKDLQALADSLQLSARFQRGADVHCHQFRQGPGGGFFVLFIDILDPLCVFGVT